jgi:hypothetical protein
VTRQKWLKFENDQLPGQTWSNLVKHGQIWSNLVRKKMVKKHGQKTWSKNMVKKHGQKTWSVHMVVVASATVVKLCTTSPRRVYAAMRLEAMVVFPTPECVPAITRVGIFIVVITGDGMLVMLMVMMAAPLSLFLSLMIFRASSSC